MVMLQIDIVGLPAAPLEAAADFYAKEMPEIRDDADIHPECDLVLVFEPAGHEHRGWRLAAVQDLGREFAPRRVNAITGDDQHAIAATLAWLDQAPGVTGQLLSVGTG